MAAFGGAEGDLRFRFRAEDVNDRAALTTTDERSGDERGMTADCVDEDE